MRIYYYELHEFVIYSMIIVMIGIIKGFLEIID